jgi:hypothetical protein
MHQPRVFPLLVGPVLLACSCAPDVGLSADALTQARARWKASAPRSYNLEWVARGMTPDGHYLVAVRDGVVARAQRVGPDGREVTIDGPDAEALRVEGLFQMLERQGERGSARFDAGLGFPSRYRGDGATGPASLDVVRLDTSPRLVRPVAVAPPTPTPSGSPSSSSTSSPSSSPGATPP